RHGGPGRHAGDDPGAGRVRGGAAAGGDLVGDGRGPYDDPCHAGRFVRRRALACRYGGHAHVCARPAGPRQRRARGARRRSRPRRAATAAVTRGSAGVTRRTVEQRHSQAVTDEHRSAGMTEASPGPTGNRRIDRVLAENYLDGIATLPMDEVRSLRKEAEQEETDLSYLRRLLQGRLDILRAELARRSGATSGTLVDALPKILADEGTTTSPRGLGRHMAAEPSRADSHRRHVEALVADVDLSNPAAH